MGCTRTSLRCRCTSSVGLDLEDAELPSGVRDELGVRDPAFRPEVLEAYEYCRAFCGYDGWLSGVAVGLDAAHVRWRTYVSSAWPVIARSPCRASTWRAPRRPGIWSLTWSDGPRGNRRPGWPRSGPSTSSGTPGRCSAARPARPDWRVLPFGSRFFGYECRFSRPFPLVRRSSWGGCPAPPSPYGTKGCPGHGVWLRCTQN